MIEQRTNTEILRAARARISDQRNFVMGALAWNRKGRAVDVTAPDAARWNPRGAIFAESGIRPSKPEDTRSGTLYGFLDDAASAVVKEQGWRIAVGWEEADNLGHVLALQAFDQAIALAEEHEGVPS